jgi:hypothetical protein
MSLQITKYQCILFTNVQFILTYRQGLLETNRSPYIPLTYSAAAGEKESTFLPLFAAEEFCSASLFA